MGDLCEYCLEAPCTCPIFDIPDEVEGVDDPTCIDADDEPTFDEQP